MARRNYIIYCDESDRKARYFSNFFGGVILKATDQEDITLLLNEKKVELNLNSEIKWEKVSGPYLEKYKEFISYYFSFVATGRLRVRVMFTQNMNVPKGLTKEQLDEQYFILYYHFLKHAFGLKYCNPNSLDRVFFHILPDQLPDKKEKIENFKNKITNIPETKDMRGSNVIIPRRHINDVDSSKHSILQGLDIILGSMCSKLNEKFMQKPEGAKRRGKRTIAKEKLYKHINSEIRNIYPNFNVGVSTGTRNGPGDRWAYPYRHWLFKPSDHKVDRSLAKAAQKVRLEVPDQDLHE